MHNTCFRFFFSLSGGAVRYKIGLQFTAIYMLESGCFGKFDKLWCEKRNLQLAQLVVDLYTWTEDPA